MTTVTITEVTDPFCTWCWGAEPIRRRLEERYRGDLEFDYLMGGLIEDFDSFEDRANGITEPRDVAPHWEEASSRHGMPVDSDIWRENPPRSTHPSNLAYIAAEFQDSDRAARYLRRLREAVAFEKRDISQPPVLVDLAAEVGLDAQQFQDDLAADRTRTRFESHRRRLREGPARAFPSFRIQADDAVTWILGYQPFDAFPEAFQELGVTLEQAEPRPIPAVLDAHGRLATRELAEIYDVSDGRMMQVLRSLEATEEIHAVEAGNGYLWVPSESTGSSERAQRPSASASSLTGARCGLDGDCTLLREDT